MATRDVPFAPGTPCWVELSASDRERSIAFYQAVFGWERRDSGEEMGHYVQFELAGRPVAGCSPQPPEPGHPDFWATYLSTDDAQASTARAIELGGTVALAPMKVASLGTMAVLADPAKAFFGLWQPGEFFGFSRYNEPGSVTWDELHSRDFRSSVAFYEALFGWEIDRTNDTDEFRYFQAKIAGEVVAGLSDSATMLPEGVPSHWAVYFSVESVDDTVERALASGGAVIQPAMDTPFGRMADVADPGRGSFKIHQAPASP